VKSKNILVVGGAGYIGSHACKALAQVGYTPISYDNLVHGHSWAVKWGPLEIGDIANSTQLESVLDRYRPRAVMHFAAYAYVGESVQHPSKYYQNNVVGTLTLLEAMRKYKINKLVFSSTCATYGTPNYVPIREDHPQAPINPYGASKWMIERILKDFDAAYDLRSISLRYFNAAGADPETEIGELHIPETHLIPLVLDVAVGSRSSITVYGNDYSTHDGTCIRDYIHVSDLAYAHVLALRALESGVESTTYNLGNGKGFSVREVIEVTESITKQQIPVEIGSRRAGDPAILVGDASRIHDELGWSPRYRTMEEIISTAWKWHLRSYRETLRDSSMYKSSSNTRNVLLE